MMKPLSTEHYQPPVSTEHYLKRELYDLVQKDVELFEFLQNGSLDGMWYWDLEHPDHEWMSPQFWRLLGYEPEEMPHLASSWQTIIHPEDRELAIANFNRHCREPNYPYDQIVRYQHKDGSTVWVRCRGLAIRDQAGKPIRMLGAHTDITTLKNTEQQLQQSNLDLMRSNQELSQFAYVASHDLQEPLRKVKSFAELLSDRYQGELDESADRYIRYITDGAIRMQGLIDDLLNYSRVGRVELNRQETNLETITQQVIEDLETVIENKNVNISLKALPTIFADSTQMRQLFQNLLSNAIKYCQADVPTVQIWATQDNENWTFSVQDNGIGIDPQFAERIFVIFQRLHNRDEYSGTGIGLAICKKIVERHGGQIWVNSNENQGSTFSFTLPINCGIQS
ncbi:ATP-binding protein [Acaryochloris sp. IP29b_bin.148]|uniref:sensor histidine kinase n=1 Tax=Acaryochloris sp. IP29b_bin.148 TaxID=2969218 RepID=UPI00261A7C98|nr:PAS domain-containing sensor histidine kinase [Acaryochloris sp. IP29b_bin.148]